MAHATWASASIDLILPRLCHLAMALPILRLRNKVDENTRAKRQAIHQGPATAIAARRRKKCSLPCGPTKTEGIHKRQLHGMIIFWSRRCSCSKTGTISVANLKCHRVFNKLYKHDAYRFYAICRKKKRFHAIVKHPGLSQYSTSFCHIRIPYHLSANVNQMSDTGGT
jgi:hypothetical protein